MPHQTIKLAIVGDCKTSHIQLESAKHHLFALLSPICHLTNHHPFIKKSYCLPICVPTLKIYSPKYMTLAMTHELKSKCVISSSWSMMFRARSLLWDSINTGYPSSTLSPKISNIPLLLSLWAISRIRSICQSTRNRTILPSRKFSRDSPARSN